MRFHRRYTLVFIPRNMHGIKELRGRLCLGGLLTAFVLALLIWSAGSTYVASYFNAGYLAELERENRNLDLQIQALDQRAALYQQRMDALVTREKESRLIAGLPDIHPDIRKVGIGGRTQPSFSEMDTDSLMALTHSIEAELEHLMRAARLEQASLAAVEEKVRMDKTYWHHIPTVRPVVGRTTSRFGMRDDPLTGMRRMHSGIDIAAQRGDEVRATASGTVVYTGRGKNYGRFIDIDHHNGFLTRYGHLSQITIRENMPVKRGDVIGLVGNSGRATGYHLHYEILRNHRATDPTSHFYPEQHVVD